MTKISAILPLKTRGRHYADNIGRCDILFSSLRHFTTPDTFARFVIVVPHDEIEAVRGYAKAWSDFPIEIVDESLHFGIFNEFSQRHQIRGWHRQQIIKLYAPALVDTEYFVVFDPDCFATHPFTADDLIIDGKALTHYLPRVNEACFWRASAEVLEIDPHLERDGMWWTPTILSRTLCINLQERLEALYRTDWRRVLLSKYTVDWTEYTLYWLNGEHAGLLDQYHVPAKAGQRRLHASESVWYADMMKEWDARQHFAVEGDGLFAVVQSNTHISLQQVVETLSPYFPITLQPYKRDKALVLRAAELYSAVVRRALRSVRRVRGG